MTKEAELMSFLHQKIFDPILVSHNVSSNIKCGINLTIGRMNRLTAQKMVQYFWSALVSDNSIKFSKKMKNEGLLRFEDVMEEFRDRFNDKWLQQ